MKYARFNQGIFTALLLLASVVNAQEYPAADFQPKVVYQDASVTAAASTVAPVSSSSSTAAPCVTQQSSATPVKPEVTSEFDPQYPASSFQPKVVFSQAN